jgi:hypothetical protein
MAAGERLNAICAMHVALDGLSPRMDAVARLIDAAIELEAAGRTMQLSVHDLTRGEHNGFDGPDKHYTPPEHSHEWWSKTVMLHDGAGRVSLCLYTTEPPVEPDSDDDEADDRDPGDCHREPSEEQLTRSGPYLPDSRDEHDRSL